ncbi:hypothetical protein VTI74DRAFT_4881 [Chaetomium olivicolor]
MVTDSRSSSEIHRKPVLGSSASSSYASPTATMATTTSGTTRTSEDSGPSSVPGTASAPLSPSEQASQFFESGPPEHSGPNKLHKKPAMPVGPPPPPPTLLTRPGTPPPPVPAVTATHPTPTHTRHGNRSPSPERPPSRAKLQPNRLQPAASPRGRSVSAQPPAVRGVSTDGSRAVSSPVASRSPSKPPSEGSPGASTDKKSKRKSWFSGGSGGRSRANSDVAKPRPTGAWIMSPDGPIDYNTAPLVNGEKIPELWNEAGNVFIYLHPKESGRGPCFKVMDYIFTPSGTLNEMLVTEMMAAASHHDPYQDMEVAGPLTEGHLYLPLGNTDLERLIAARNLFAFLTHQPLVGTPERPTLFTAMLQIAGLLREFNFSSYDGSSYGESVDAAFDLFLDQTGIADVRHSREKTLEGLVLAEQMKSWNLYNEAFVHAVGKYESLLELKSPLYEQVSVSTRKRLDRAHLDLVNRQANVNTRLESFEFPSLFAGIASSTSTEEYRNVKFKEWRNSFGKMRNFVLGYYKGLFGNWPPRARSKKNYFSQSGLNRQALKILYSDMCALYDLLVDRQSLTPRVIGEGYEDPTDEKKEMSPHDAMISALRKVLSEFDKSSPPVLPPIPFDIPKIPTMTAIYENYNDLPAKKQLKYSKGLQPHELQLLLIKSRNIDTDALQMPFLLAYKDFELREARFTNPQDLADQRIGYWLFLYVTLQSLPMLVVDAPGLRYTDGVEDFLCEAPQGNPPWTEDAGEVRKMWYQTADQNIVELSADVVMFSVEGIYMRSHCWLAAKEWEATQGGTSLVPPSSTNIPAPAAIEQATSPLQPPRAVFRDMDPFAPASTTHHQQQRRSSSQQSPAEGLSPANSPHLRPRSGSTNDRARQAFRASIAIGLEPLPMPAGVGVGGDHRASRVLSSGSVSSIGGHGSPGLAAGGAGGEVLLGLRASRSAVNLAGGGGGGGSNDFLGAGVGVGAGGVRKSSYGGFGSGMAGPGPGHHHQHQPSESLGGGSTFDDILKGMDNGKKAKKKTLFF